MAQHGTWHCTKPSTWHSTAQRLWVPPRYLLGGHIPLPCHHLTQLCGRAQQWHRQPHAQRAPALTLQHQRHIQCPGDIMVGMSCVPQVWWCQHASLFAGHRHLLSSEFSPYGTNGSFWSWLSPRHALTWSGARGWAARCTGMGRRYCSASGSAGTSGRTCTHGHANGTPLSTHVRHGDTSLGMGGHKAQPHPTVRAWHEAQPAAAHCEPYCAVMQGRGSVLLSPTAMLGTAQPPSNTTGPHPAHRAHLYCAWKWLCTKLSPLAPLCSALRCGDTKQMG